MKIILSPAKKMNIKLDILEPMGLPMFIDRSMDGVTPYRLEMQAKAVIENEKNLYDYWGDSYHSFLYFIKIYGIMFFCGICQKERC